MLILPFIFSQFLRIIPSQHFPFNIFCCLFRLSTNSPTISMTILNLVEFSFSFLFHSIALIRLILIFRYKLTARKEIAPFMMTILANWTAVCALALLYEGYSVLTWRPASQYYHDGRVMFFIALPCNQVLAMIPVSVFYLTLDRILIIHYGCNYGSRAKKVLMYAYGGTLLVCLFYCMTWFLLALPNVSSETKCEIFGCLLDSSLQFYLGWRAFCSVFNFGGGIVFFVFLYKTNQKLATHQQHNPVFTITQVNKQEQKVPSRHSKNNRMAILAIVIEFFLAFLPHIGPTVWEKIYGPGSSTVTGPISMIASSIEVLIFVSVYSHVLKSQGQNSTLTAANVGENPQWAGRVARPPPPQSSTRQTHHRVFSREQQYSR